MNTLELLAQDWANCTDLQSARMLISRGLADSKMDEFITQHSCGWSGVTGAYARKLAQLRHAIDLEFIAPPNTKVVG